MVFYWLIMVTWWSLILNFTPSNASSLTKPEKLTFLDMLPDILIPGSLPI